MSISSIQIEAGGATAAEQPAARPRTRKVASEPLTLHSPTRLTETSGNNHQAEQFYLQKQVQTQTQMVVVLDNGATIEGVIEWYDRHSIKLRGRNRTLIYKNSIKYMYKVSDSGRQL